VVMDREQLRDTLRALLHEAGLGQREASRLLGMSDTTVHNWLAGHSEPRLQSLRDFAQLCGRQAVIDFPRLGEADPLRLLEGEQADEVRQLVPLGVPRCVCCWTWPALRATPASASRRRWALKAAQERQQRGLKVPLNWPGKPIYLNKRPIICITLNQMSNRA
jgi:transcriptional regulator with XRE-family HTH domain